MIDVGQRIRQVRGEMSRNAFAEALGIHPQTLYMYEKGKRVADIGFVQKICQKFNVSVEWIVFGTAQNENDFVENENEELKEELEEKIKLIEEKDNKIQSLMDDLLQAQSETIKLYEMALKKEELDKE